MKTFFVEDSARWAIKEELEKMGVRYTPGSRQPLKAGGTPLFQDGADQIFLANGHSAIFGTTDSGKTQSIILPSICSSIIAQENLVVFDPKAGELFQNTSSFARKHGYRVILLDFLNPGCSDRWSAFALPEQSWRAGELDISDQYINEIARSVYAELDGAKDPFWQITAKSYFAGLCKVLRNSEGQMSFRNILNLHIANKRKTGLKPPLKEWLELYDTDGSIARDLEATLNAPTDTKACIESVFLSPLSKYATNGMTALMSDTDFRIADLEKEKIALYILTPPSRRSFDHMVVLFLEQLFCTVTDGKPLKRQLNIILEEFSCLPKIEDFSTVISIARSYRIRFQLCVQSVQQLYAKYGEETNTILNNCAAWYVVRSKDHKMYQLLEPLCGDRMSPFTQTKLPLLSFRDIQHFAPGEAVILLDGCDPFHTQLIPFRDYRFTNKTTKIEKRIPKSQGTAPQPFDIFEAIKNGKERRKLQELDSLKKEALEWWGNTGHKICEPENQEQILSIDDLMANIDAEIEKLTQEAQADDSKQ